MPLVERIATARGWSIEVLAKAGCPPARLKLIDPQLGREYRECDVWREHALGRITTGRAPKLIVVGMLNRYSPDREQMSAALAEPVARLTGTGAPVVYIRDIPFPERDVPACVSGALDRPQKCVFPRTTAILPDVLADAGWPGVSVVNVNDVLCPGVGCPAVLDGVLLYRDDAHLTNTAATLLAARMERTLVNFGVLR